jgi:hypothetical protein
MALDHHRQRGELAGLDRFLHGVFVLRGRFRQLQQDLRIAGRDDRFHDWMWLSVMVVLGGAEIDAVLEHAAGRPGPPPR